MKGLREHIRAHGMQCEQSLSDLSRNKAMKTVKGGLPQFLVSSSFVGDLTLTHSVHRAWGPKPEVKSNPGKSLKSYLAICCLAAFLAWINIWTTP